MTLKYMGLAVRDLDKASAHAVKIGLPDPVTYMAQLKAALERRYSNRDPGIAGRKIGTHEWLLTDKRYVVVIKWVKADCKIYRILPMGKVRNRRPNLIATAVR